MSVCKKILWIAGKSCRYCFSAVLVLVLINVIPGMMEIAVNIVNRRVINELVVGRGTGEAGAVFAGLLLAYVSLRLVRNAWGFLDALGYNYARLDIGMFFNKILMQISSRIPQEMFYQSDFMERYTFAANSVDKIGFFLYAVARIFVGNIWSVAGTILLFGLYEPRLVPYMAVMGIVTVLIQLHIAKKQYELDKKQIREQRFHDYYKNC